MSIKELYHVSPLGCVGSFLLGGVYSAMFGMAAVYGTESGLSVAKISSFIASIYIGGLLLQYPIGWASDRIDRRQLILGAAVVGGLGALLALVMQGNFAVLLFSAFVIGGTSNPLYALLIAYTNDFLEHEDMAAASGGLIFLNGVGAISGPLITGWIMGQMGPGGFFLYLVVLMFALSAYAAFRMTQRPAPAISDTGSYAPILPSATPVAVEVAQEVFIETLEEEEAAAEDAA